MDGDLSERKVRSVWVSTTLLPPVDLRHSSGKDPSSVVIQSAISLTNTL